MSNQFKFVKMQQCMVVKCGECYERFSVLDTREATHDWRPAKLIDRRENESAQFHSKFEELWSHQNQPMVDEQSVIDSKMESK